MNHTNGLALFIPNMKLSYNGSYTCQAHIQKDNYVAQNTTVIKVKPSKYITIAYICSLTMMTVLLKIPLGFFTVHAQSFVSGKRSCADTQFMCGTGECIFKRYTCDNISDCKDASDEDLSICGKK